jgi:protein required for attachment to host cells
MSILVVVADSARARILRAEDRKSPLIESKALIFPEARLREQDLVSDGAGSGGGNGAGSHSMGHEKDAHRHQVEIFARELCQDLERSSRADRVHKIYLIAAPKFLGLIRASLGKACAELVCGELPKDLINHSIAEIRKQLPKML